jgi:hypothetical protein
MQPEDPMEEAFVRLTVLEFVLEVMLANILADVAQDTSALAKRDLVLRKPPLGQMSRAKLLRTEMRAGLLTAWAR